LIDRKQLACHQDGKCGICCTRIENFNVSFNGMTILENINLHIHCGELTAIVGPNGGGKSTLIRSILGEIKHTGKLSFHSCSNIGRDEPVMGYVPQKLTFDTGLPVSVLDFMAASRTNFPVWIGKRKETRYRIQESLAKVNAEYLIDRRLGELSGGELQRMLLALALSPMPDILLLDEPFTGVDRKGMELFYETVSRLREKFDMTIILISHDFELVSKYADRVVLLNKRVLCIGKPGDVFASSHAREIFGESVSREYGAGGQPV